MKQARKSLFKTTAKGEEIKLASTEIRNKKENKYWLEQEKRTGGL